MSDAPWSGRRLHFIGIGGAGMSGLAIVALGLGAQVSGSDRAESAYTERLRELGLAPAIGHDPGNLPDGAEVVVSTAISEDNVELAAAREAGARILHRGELLGEVSRLKRCLAVAGTHGKTTTASMVAHALVECGRRPGYLVGGEVRSTGTNASWGQGDWVVVEADESDRSFLRLQPDVAVVTNVELDHHSTYRTLPEVEQAFAEFAGPAPRVIVPAGLELHGVPPSLTFGIESGTLAARELDLLPLGSRFTVDGVAVELRVPGRHNVLNALAALAACREAGVSPQEAAPALGSFTGAARRFEPHGRGPNGALVFDDYAHHPAEIRASIEAVRARTSGRVVVLFQPHTPSRLRAFFDDFADALRTADVRVVAETFASARESPDARADARALASRAGGAYAADAAAAARVLAENARSGDLVLVLGAGDIRPAGERLLELLRDRATV